MCPSRVKVGIARRPYNQSSSAAVNDCTVEIGINTGGTCTLANQCSSCLSVPVCFDTLLGNAKQGFVGAGYGSPFEFGLIAFSTQYHQLESNLTSYYSNIKINPQNPQSSISNFLGSFDNISNVTHSMYNDPIFIPQATVDYSQCPTSGVGGPSYCYLTPICNKLTYNFSLLNNIQQYVTQISQLPISSTQINDVAASINSNENIYITPKLSAEKLDQVKLIKRTTLSGYNGTVAGATVLLMHITNATLQTDLTRVQANYTTLTVNYVPANLIALNKTLATQYSTFNTLYVRLNSSYSAALDLASNNTVNLVELQSGNSNPSSQLTALSFQQAGLNSQLGASIKNLSMLIMQLQSVNKQASSISNYPSVTQTVARIVGAPFAHVVLASIGASYPEALSLAPVLSLIPALMAGILLLIVLFWLHSNLAKSHRLAISHKTSKNWQMLYIIAGVVVVLFLFATYTAASSANQYAPISAFVSSVHSSKTVIIALNGTNNTAMILCAAKVKASITAIGKQTQTITMGGIACNNGMPLETVDKCLAYYAANNEPVVIFTNSSADSIGAYSYYGSVLNVNGDPQFMNSCIASTMIR